MSSDCYTCGGQVLDFRVSMRLLTIQDFWSPHLFLSQDFWSPHLFVSADITVPVYTSKTPPSSDHIVIVKLTVNICTLS